MADPTFGWTRAHTAALVLLPVALVAVMLQAAVQDQLLAAWVIAFLGMAVTVVVFGHGITRRWLGALIDERNVVSLSRFQMIAWTVLVLSAFLTAVLANVVQPGVADPLAIGISHTLWALLGISTTSLVASPLILSGKTAVIPDPKEQAATFGLLARQGADRDQLDNKGQLVVNKDVSQARLSDMFTGEETGNAAHLDLTRVQMFFFTMVTLASYGVVLAYFFAGHAPGPIDHLPPLNTSMLALIGISHAGYLTAKAVPRSGTGEALAAPAGARGLNPSPVLTRPED